MISTRNYIIFEEQGDMFENITFPDTGEEGLAHGLG